MCGVWEAEVCCARGIFMRVRRCDASLSRICWRYSVNELKAGDQKKLC